MNAYVSWLEALSGHYFNEERAGRLTILYASRGMIERVGEENGIGGWDDFMGAIRKGPNHRRFPHYLDLEHAFQLDERWEPSIPTWKLPALVLLVLAWTEKPEGCHGYYEAFESIVSTHQLGMVEDSRKLVDSLTGLLAGIESWAFGHDLKYGLFLDEQLQSFRKVGRVKYHALVPDSERRLFGYFWHASGLQPGALVDSELLLKQIHVHPDAGKLLPSFCHLVENTHLVVQMAVNELVKIEFGQWDGSYVVPEDSLEDRRMDSPLLLYRCLDRLGRVGVRLYHDYLRGKVQLVLGAHALSGTIGDSGWSGWLQGHPGGGALLLDSGLFNAVPSILGDMVVKWRYNGAGPRILGNAMEAGIVADEWVEVGKLAPWRPVKLLYSDSHAGQVNRWIAAGGCGDPPRIQSLSGGWFALSGGCPVFDFELKGFESVNKPLVPWTFSGGKKVRAGMYDVLSLPKVAFADDFDPESVLIRAVSSVPDHSIRLNEVEGGYQLVAEPGYLPGPGGDRWKVEVVGEEQPKALELVVCNLLPKREYADGAGWFWSRTGKLHGIEGGQIDHARVMVSGLEPLLGEFDFEGFVKGSAEEPPIGWQLASALLAEANGEGLVKYPAFRKCIRQWCLTRHGFEPSKLRLGRLLKEMAAMGYFMADPAQQIIQLAPPSLVLMPPNDRTIRVLLTGIWSEAMLQVVVKYCSAAKHCLQLQWFDQADSLLPSLPFLVAGHFGHLDRLREFLGHHFPGYGSFYFQSSYGWDILRSLENPYPTLSAEALGEIEIGRFRESEQYLDPFTYRYVDQVPDCGFPVLGRSYDRRMGYAKFIWWESDDCGFEVDGDWGGWQLLLRHGTAQIVQCSERSDLILLPGLSMPSVLERALTLASGKVPRREWLPDGGDVQYWVVEGISYPLRLELPRIFWGADHEKSLSFYAIQSLTF